MFQGVNGFAFHTLTAAHHIIAALYTDKEQLVCRCVENVVDIASLHAALSQCFEHVHTLLNLEGVDRFERLSRARIEEDGLVTAERRRSNGDAVDDDVVIGALGGRSALGKELHGGWHDFHVVSLTPVGVRAVASAAAASVCFETRRAVLEDDALFCLFVPSLAGPTCPELCSQSACPTTMDPPCQQKSLC